MQVGLFDFARNIGRKPDVEAQEAKLNDLDMAIDLKQYARTMDLPVDDVKYAVTDGSVTITGSVPSQVDKEKVVLAAGNTEGIGKVDDQLTVAAVAAPEPADAAGEAAADALVAKMKREAQMKAAAVKSEASETQMGAQSQFYTVVKGDTLWKIATETLGDGSRYPEIFEANKPMLTDPDLIYPDQVLRIPNA